MASDVSGTVARVALVLKYLAEASDDVTIREASESLRLPPSTVHRLFDLLRGAGLVERDSALHRYRSGPELYRIAGLVSAKANLAASAQPILVRMTRVTSEAAVLAQYDAEKQRVYWVAKADANHPFQLRVQLFEPMLVTEGASGWAVLASMDQVQLREALVRNNLGGSTKTVSTRLAALKRELQLVKARGYAVSRSERLGGAVEVASPVFGREARLLGSLAIVIPEARFSDRSGKSIADVVRREASALSHLAGHLLAAQ